MNPSLSLSVERSADAVQIEPSRTNPRRLNYIDSFRGLAALAVVLLHAFQMYGVGLIYQGIEVPYGPFGTSTPQRVLSMAYNGVFSWGHYAVEVFIVLSGYSLMIPVARSLDGRMRGSLRNFLYRRSKRILPPYFAALGVSLLVIMCIPGMGAKTNVYWDIALPALTPDVLVSHLLLIHNYSPEWSQKINPVMWSIAVEWQLYFWFPLLVWLWRVRGITTMLAVAFIAGVLPIYLGSFSFPLSDSHYLGLFALGMAGALLSFSQQPLLANMRERFPWMLGAFGCLVAFFAIGMVDKYVPINATAMWTKDTLIGAATVCLLVLCATGGRQWSLLMRLLESRPLVQLGHFSYSLYLIHAPVLACIALVCRQLAVSLSYSYAALLVIGVPLAIGVSYLFHYWFERPFIRNMAKQPVVR